MIEQFRYFLRVRDYECDASNVVCDGSYANYARVATSEFLRALPGQDLLHGELDFQLAKQEIKLHAQARYDDILEITVWVRRLGRSSVAFATEFRIAGSETLVGFAETVRGVVDAATRERKALSHSVREILKKGGEGLIVDHAGYLPLDDYLFS
ncbi:MAG TPA: hotdog domain-containing protein [Geomonas sp.]|nr:hotdog domain-containing protein [Geomonas sp.]